VATSNSTLELYRSHNISIQSKEFSLSAYIGAGRIFVIARWNPNCPLLILFIEIGIGEKLFKSIAWDAVTYFRDR